MFENLNTLTKAKFNNKFGTEEKCLEYLANEKWKDGYVCRNCDNTKYCTGKKPFSRRCSKCKTFESATAHTIFHSCKMPIQEAFTLAFMVCKNPAISSYELAELTDGRQMTCWKFKTKILECLEKNKQPHLTSPESGGI